MFAYIRKNMKYALKSVFLNYKEYLSFFAAVFILQTFFWMLTFSNQTNNIRALEVIEENYTQHIIVENMNGEQALTLYNDTVHIRIMNEGVESIKFSDGGSTAKITFYEENKAKNADYFVRKYLNKLSTMGDEHSITLTPLLTYDTEYRASNNTTYWLIMIVLAVIATFLLMALYYIRVNNFRFRYGIYMTFGADFKKLLGNSIWEMLSMSLIMAIPSGLLSAWLTHMNYAKVGVEACYSFGNVIRVLLFNCVVVVAAVWLPMKATSRKWPMSLIISEDNSNYVSSPRMSSSLMSSKSFPHSYELLGLWRYRKYYLKLLLIAISFSALFICGLYVAQMNRTAETRDLNEYSIVYTGSRPNREEVNLDGEDFMLSLNDMPEVDYVTRSVESSAVNLGSHILIERDNKYFSGKYILPCDHVEGYSYAFSNLNYIAADSLYMDMLENSGRYDIEGDLMSVINNPKTVAVSENIYNERHIRFRVGDTVAVARAVKRPFIEELDGVSKASVIFQMRLDRWTYEYEIYTVGAVIKNAEAGDGIMFCVNDEDYTAITRQEPVRKRLDVYLSDDVQPDAAEGIFESISAMMANYDGWSVSKNGTSFDKLLIARKNNYDMILTIAMAILVISPVVWFFSQLLFWRKRNGEMYILRAFGAIESEVRRIHIVSGIAMAVISFVMTLVMGYAANYLLYQFCNNILPSLGIGSGIRYEYYISVGALISSAIIAIVCGFLSSLLPYYIEQVRMRRTLVRQNAGATPKSRKEK